MIGILSTSALLLSLAVGPLPQANGDSAGPPGLVYVKGGKFTIGANFKDLEPLMTESEAYRNALIAETPEHRLELDDYYLMPTEVTNEQYAAYVRATKGKPPFSWADQKALTEARNEFLAEQGKLREDARARGERLEKMMFDDQAWWEANWQKHPNWSVPDADLSLPVVRVNFQDAQNYARWAGLRLMTEFEFQAAGRGDSARSYPWGDEWKANMCASFELGRDRPAAVGSFKEGGSAGIFDLSGNVWEWTSSKYTAFPRYKSESFKIGKRKLDARAPFDPNKRVAVGGCYSNQMSGCRLTIRFGAERTQATEALGFRCAASAEPGLDATQALIDTGRVPRNLPGLEEIDFYLDHPAVFQRWMAEAGSVEVPGYAVIQAYESNLFSPVMKVDANSLGTLSKGTETNGPVLLGFMSLRVPTLEPALAPGEYFIAWRGPAKFERDETNPAAIPPGFAEFDQAPGFDPEQEQFILHDAGGVPVAAIPAPVPVFDRQREQVSGSFRVEAFVPPTPEELEQMAEDGVTPPPARDTFWLDFVVASSSRGKAFFFKLPLLVEPNSIDDSWRGR